MADKQPDTGQNGQEKEREKYEQELADYLQERIKPGLNSGAIPLLARSIAKSIAERGQPAAPAGDAAEEAPDFEADMHELQTELGEDWILRFSVHGDDAWLTAEKKDGSQQLDAQTAEELVKAVHKEGGDGSS